MKKVLIIGSGLSGLTCSVKLAELGIKSLIVSPYPSERAQSVMAAGGINAAIGQDDDVSLHAEETYQDGCCIDDYDAIKELCENAPTIIEWLESLGTVFTRDESDKISLRAFGGQSKKRTVFAGASTGKQIMTALINEARKYENLGLIERRMGRYFHSALIDNGICYGAVLYNDVDRKMELVITDAVVAASGGQNALFGKTTGSLLCDGYVTGKLFIQGATLKNLEFIQYHPTTIETSQKRMLITEACRGEGGRLYYLKGNQRIYFMEDIYGPSGNLMPRDIVAKHIYDAPSQVYLDISFLGKDLIDAKLSEVKELCKKYINLDVTKDSIPVYPSVHFFMGGLAVNKKHQTNIKNLYAIGECASMYHGANRLGGNSLLAAIRGGCVASLAIKEDEQNVNIPDFSNYEKIESKGLEKNLVSKSNFSAFFIRQEIAKIMDKSLGITRSEEKLKAGIEDIEYYINICDRLIFDDDVSYYISYSLKSLLVLAKAILLSALNRKETRGAHIRIDYPNKLDEYSKPTYIKYMNGLYDITIGEE